MEIKLTNMGRKISIYNVNDLQFITIENVFSKSHIPISKMYF